jgi:hypothetical protein
MNHRPDSGGDALDQAASQAWQASLEHVPPGIRRQLRPASTRIRQPALGWPLAAACTAGALAVGLHLHHEPATPVAPIVAPAVAENGDEAASAWAALEQTPDFFLWLASADTAALELE